MAKASGSTRTSTSKSPKGLNLQGTSINVVGLTKFERNVDHYRAQEVYEMGYLVRGSEKLDKLTVATRMIDSDGFHKVELPQTTNTAVVTATEAVLRKLSSERYKFETTVEVGTSQETFAKLYSFNAVGNVIKDPSNDKSYRRYRRG